MDVDNFIDLISQRSRQYLQCKCRRDKSKQYGQVLWCHKYGVFSQGQWVKEMCYIETLKTELHICRMQTSQQNQRRFGTTSILRGVLLIGCSPDTPANPSSRTFFLYWLFIRKFCTKDDRNVHCKILNKLDHGEKVMEKFPKPQLVVHAVSFTIWWRNAFRHTSSKYFKGKPGSRLTFLHTLPTPKCLPKLRN